MSDSSKLPSVESRWATVLEYAVFGLPAMVGISFALALYWNDGSFGTSDFLLRLAVAIYIVGLVGGLVLSALFAVGLYLDAKRVGDADVSWEPSPVLYGVGGFFVWLAAYYYLYKRYEHTAPGPTWAGWWYGVAASFAVVAVVGITTVLPISLTGGILAAVGASVTVLPIAIYKDAVHVRGGESDWFPNPVNYFFAVFVGSFLLFVPVAVSGYYLYKRHSHVGVP